MLCSTSGGASLPLPYGRLVGSYVILDSLNNNDDG